MKNKDKVSKVALPHKPPATQMLIVSGIVQLASFLVTAGYCLECLWGRPVGEVRDDPVWFADAEDSLMELLCASYLQDPSDTVSHGVCVCVCVCVCWCVCVGVCV